MEAGGATGSSTAGAMADETRDDPRKLQYTPSGHIGWTAAELAIPSQSSISYAYHVTAIRKVDGRPILQGKTTQNTTTVFPIFMLALVFQRSRDYTRPPALDCLGWLAASLSGPSRKPKQSILGVRATGAR